MTVALSSLHLSPFMTTPAPAATDSGVSPEKVKQLREKTNAGMMDCKKALVEAMGDLAAAETILRKKGAATASKKAGREAKEGVIGSYIHVGDKVGVLVEINCETDFVARNESFRSFVKDVTLQVAAAAPLYVKRDEVPASALATEKEVAAAQIKDKPANVVEKIVSGKLDKYYSTVCLLEQAFVKDNTKTISDLLRSASRSVARRPKSRWFNRYTTFPSRISISRCAAEATSRLWVTMTMVVW
jgi:elongation factor Ts